MHSHNVLIGIPLREKPMKFSEVLMVMLASLMVNTPNNILAYDNHRISSLLVTKLYKIYILWSIENVNRKGI